MSYVARGLSHERKGDTAAALADYRKAAGTKPNNDEQRTYIEKAKARIKALASE